MFLKIPMLLGDISIHTFSLYHTLKYEEYLNIFQQLEESNCDRSWSDEYLFSSSFPPIFQIEKGLRIQLRNYKVCSINIIVSPLLLVQKDEQDYKKIAPADSSFWNAAYDSLLESFRQWEFPFEPCECALSRADPCMNLEMGPEFDIPTYLYYLKHTPCKEGYILQSFGDPQKDKYSYKVKNTMQALAVYAKSAQQESCFDALPDGSNILRMELQMENKKIGKIYGCRPTWNTLLCLVPDAPALMEDDIRSILPTGDYRTGNDVYQIIYNSDRRIKVKNELWDLIQQYSKAQNQAEQIKISKDYIAEKSQKKFDKRMYALNNLNIAPVCLDNGDKIDYLPSLYNLTQEGVRQFEEQLRYRW